MRHNFASPVATRVQESPFNQMSSGSDLREDQEAKYVPKKKGRQGKHHKKSTEEILQDERGKNVFREIAKMTKQTDQ